MGHLFVSMFLALPIPLIFFFLPISTVEKPVFSLKYTFLLSLPLNLSNIYIYIYIIYLFVGEILQRLRHLFLYVQPRFEPYLWYPKFHHE